MVLLWVHSQHQHQGKRRARASCSLDCIDRVAFTPALGLFGLQLSCIFPFAAACRAPGAAGPAPNHVTAGLCEHSEKQSYGSGVPPEPRFLQATMGASPGAARSFVPDCPGCWGQLGFWESAVTPWKLLMGTGLEGSSVAFHWRTKSALGTFTQPHSISREVGAGLSPAGGTEAKSWC